MRKTQSFLGVSFILLALSGLLFGGCSSGSDDSDPGAQEATFTSLGSPKVYDYDNSDIYSGSPLTFTNFSGSSRDSLTFANFANVTVATDGTLSFPLSIPSEAALTDLDAWGFTVETEGTKCFWIESVNDGSDRELGYYIIGGDSVVAALMYADRDSRITGSVTQGMTMNVNLILKTGWNWVITTYTENSKTMISGKPGNNFRWETWEED
jgi:hypothetical protein